MKLGEKEQVFKMSWIEKLKLLGIVLIIYVMMMLFYIPMLTNYQVFLVVSLIVMFPLTVFLLYQLIFMYNKKIVINTNQKTPSQIKDDVLKELSSFIGI